MTTNSCHAGKFIYIKMKNINKNQNWEISIINFPKSKMKNVENITFFLENFISNKNTEFIFNFQFFLLVD